MRPPLIVAFALVAFGLPNPCPCLCFGRQPRAAGEQENPAEAAIDREAAIAKVLSVRPQGAIERPTSGFQHPDIDKAWGRYDEAVEEEAENIRAIIGERFDDATKEGDLEKAETWQASAEVFERSGVLPRHKETQAAVGAAQKRLIAAKTTLTTAYGDVIKSLTKEKRITDAQAVRTERDSLGTAQAKKERVVQGLRGAAGGDAKRPPEVEAIERSVAQRRRDFAGREAPPVDINTMTDQLLSVTDTIVRNPGRVPPAMIEVIEDDGGLFNALVAAVEAGDDSAVAQALGKFSPNRLKEMDTLVVETDWGRWPRRDTNRTNAQILLAAWEAKLRSLQHATDPPSGTPPKPVNHVVVEAKDFARSIPADKGLRVAPEWEGLTIPAKAELIWEIDLATEGERYLHVLYASEQVRPCAISLNGKRVSTEALAKMTGGFMTKDLRWEKVGLFRFRKGRNLLSIKPDVVGPHLSRMVISTSKEPPVSEVP